MSKLTRPLGCADVMVDRDASFVVQDVQMSSSPPMRAKTLSLCVQVLFHVEGDDGCKVSTII